MPPIADIIAAARNCQRAMSLRTAALARRETVDTADAAGRIAAAAVCPCPPGVPVVMPGERISADCARLLNAMGVGKVECVL